jgi:hypothetical protein
VGDCLGGWVMRYTSLVHAFAGAALLSGCSDLEVVHLSQEDNAPLVGAMSYYLPRGAINFAGTVTLSTCEDKPDDPKKSDGSKHIEIQGTAVLTSTVTTEPDPKHHYYISYENARSWMKEINYTVNSNTGGSLQSFNTAINDQAGPDIVAAIGAVVQIGGAAGVTRVGAVPQLDNATKLESNSNPPPPPPPLNCGTILQSDVYAALQKIKPLNDKIKKIKESPATGAADVAAQAQAILAAQSQIDGAAKQAKLTRSFTFKWIPGESGDSYASYGQFVVISRKIDFQPMVVEWLTKQGKDWLRCDTLPKSNVLSCKRLATSDGRVKLRSPFLATLAIAANSIGTPDEPDVRKDGNDGLIIRDPATATLRLCQSLVDADCSPRSAVQTDNKIIETTSDKSPRMALKLPQYGRLMVLTERSGLFENATLNATLNPDGTISTIGYHSASTLANGLQGLGTAAGNATSAIAARNTAIASKNTAEAAVTTAKTNQVQAPDTYNKALADCLNNQATILKAGGSPVSCQ